jgi:hypothetical protein
MVWNIAEGNWKQFKGRITAQRGNLTDDHLDVNVGKPRSTDVQEPLPIDTETVVWCKPMPFLIGMAQTRS